jgi:hypothetical protein
MPSLDDSPGRMRSLSSTPVCCRGSPDCAGRELGVLRLIAFVSAKVRGWRSELFAHLAGLADDVVLVFVHGRRAFREASHALGVRVEADGFGDRLGARCLAEHWNLGGDLVGLGGLGSHELQIGSCHLKRIEHEARLFSTKLSIEVVKHDLMDSGLDSVRVLQGRQGEVCGTFVVPNVNQGRPMALMVVAVSAIA